MFLILAIILLAMFFVIAAMMVININIVVVILSVCVYVCMRTHMCVSFHTHQEACVLLRSENSIHESVLPFHYVSSRHQLWPSLLSKNTFIYWAILLGAPLVILSLF